MIWTGIPGAGVVPEYWSRKYENDAGELKARLNVRRKLCVGVGLKTRAARGENCVPSIRELTSMRPAAR
jgi:hypothetical protein